MSIPTTIPNVLRHKPIPFSKTREHAFPVIPGIKSLSLSSERFSQSIWEEALDGMRITDENGVIIAVNPAYCMLVGMQAHELEGQPLSVVYDPASAPADVIEKYKKRFRERSVEGLLSRHVVLRNGKHLHVESANAFITSDNGATLLLGIFRDETDRMVAEQALRVSEEKYRNVFEAAQDVIFVLSSKGTITSINPAVERKTGVPQSEWVGKHLSDMVHADDFEIVRETFRALIRKRSEITCELRIRVNNGAYLIGEFTCVPQYKGGRLASILGVVRDVTERKAAEQALFESEKKYHELFDNAIQGMFQSSPDGKLIAANPTLLRMLGYSSIEELQVVDLATVYVNHEDRERLMQTLNEQGTCTDVELRFRRKDGAVVTALEHSRVVKDAEGRVVRYEGIIEDITARKALEAKLHEYVAALKTSRESLSQLNEQKDKLFSVLSHDLRSPFSSILGFCDILLQEGEQLSAEERKEFLTYIRESAEQQLGLVNKLLEWSRLETGRIKLEIKELDLRTVVRSSITSLLGIAKQKDILLYSNLGPGLTIRGDEDLLGQVFTNLIGNALKFTPENGVIAVEFAQDTGDAWMIALRDSGAGIPQEDLSKLFKVGEKYTRKGLAGEKGTGLGLPLVYEIVQKHHGTITVESEVGKGTIFTLKFPKFSPKQQDNVVIVDDEQGVRTLHARYLRKAYPHANVILASNGKEALQCAKKYSPKLIISDYAMPEMDGIQLLQLLKQEPGTKDIPVLMITGEDSDASKEALRLTGAYDVLVKPVSVEAMEKVVQALGVSGQP